MTNASWIDVNRVVSAEPGPRDSFVVTLVDGKPVAVESVDAFEKALHQANVLALRINQPVKLLPMQVGEWLNFIRLDRTVPAPPQPDDAEMRRLAIATCREAMVEAPDKSTRVEARNVLLAMGEVA